MSLLKNIKANLKLDLKSLNFIAVCLNCVGNLACLFFKGVILFISALCDIIGMGFKYAVTPIVYLYSLCLESDKKDQLMKKYLANEYFVTGFSYSIIYDEYDLFERRKNYARNAALIFLAILSAATTIWVFPIIIDVAKGICFIIAFAAIVIGLSVSFGDTKL